MYVNTKTGIGVTLSYNEHLAIDGNRFVLTENTTFATNDIRLYFLTAPSNKSTNLSINMASCGIAKVDLFEGPNVTISGLTSGANSISGGSNSASYAFNSNRQEQGSTTTTTISANPAIYTTSGNRIFTGTSISGTPVDCSFSLAKGTQYLVNFVGVGNSNNTSWRLDWYEN